MKNKEKNTDKLKETHNHLKSFIKGLKEVSEEISESEFEQYLKVDILPGLVEDKTVYGVSIWDRMDIVKMVFIDSVLENRGLSFEEATWKMNVNAMCWLIEHIHAIKRVMKLVTPATRDEKWAYDILDKDLEELQHWLSSDMHERIQEYQHEIKELREVKA